MLWEGNLRQKQQYQRVANKNDRHCAVVKTIFIRIFPAHMESRAIVGKIGSLNRFDVGINEHSYYS